MTSLKGEVWEVSRRSPGRVRLEGSEHQAALAGPLAEGGHWSGGEGNRDPHPPGPAVRLVGPGARGASPVPY